MLQNSADLLIVFLRSMEYFNGIIFLVGLTCGDVTSSSRFQTTNIAANIDDAFLSRISVPIRFNWLNQSQCRELWCKYFKLHEKEGQIEIDERVKSWVRSDSEACKLNGREIRNGKKERFDPIQGTRQC